MLAQGHWREADDYDSPQGTVPNSGYGDYGFRARADRYADNGVFSLAWQSDLGRDIERPRTNSEAVRFYYPAEDSHRVTDEQHQHPRPRRKAGWVVVFRRSYAVYRRELSRAAFRLLSDLAAGQPPGRALAAAGRRRGAPEAETLFAWFREWSADGLFTRLECPERTAPEA